MRLQVDAVFGQHFAHEGRGADQHVVHALLDVVGMGELHLAVIEAACDARRCHAHHGDRFRRRGVGHHVDGPLRELLGIEYPAGRLAQLQRDGAHLVIDLDGRIGNADVGPQVRRARLFALVALVMLCDLEGKRVVAGAQALDRDLYILDRARRHVIQLHLRDQFAIDLQHHLRHVRQHVVRHGVVQAEHGLGHLPALRDGNGRCSVRRSGSAFPGRRLR